MRNHLLDITFLSTGDNGDRYRNQTVRTRCRSDSVAMVLTTIPHRSASFLYIVKISFFLPFCGVD